MPPKIESYHFGSIRIDGKTYNSDVIITPDKIIDGWWRKEGHSLHIEDIKEVLIRTKPEVLIVGTGAMGILKIREETKKFIEDLGITLIAQRTGKAWKKYNELIQSGKRVVAALHLTC